MSVLEKIGIDKARLAEARRCVHSETQQQTGDIFGFKWSRRDSYDSESVKNNHFKWMMERYCDNDAGVIDKWLAGGRKIILDAGCGSGFSGMLFFGDRLRDHDYVGVDISDSVTVAEERFREAGYPGTFVKMDVTKLPAKSGSIDMIFSDGVLHHTDDTGAAIKSLARLLKKDGLFLFYVYAKKAVIREFCDDHIRRELLPLGDEEAWEALKPLTRLGVELGKMGVEIDVPEDIPYLGIKKGKIDLQRFFYWNVFKAFYRSEFSLEEMNHINFDWYRPLNCHRQTPEEVGVFCRNAGLAVEHVNVQEAGITVVARKV